MSQFNQAVPDRSKLERCLLILGADESLAAGGGQYDDDNPKLDWTWHFQINLLELPCTVQSPDGELSTPWQMLYDLEPASTAWGLPIELCVTEDCPTFQTATQRFVWPDDEALAVTDFVVRFAECFSGQLSAYQLKWYQATDGADVACIVMSKTQENTLRNELGEWFQDMFLSLSVSDVASEFEAMEL